MTEEKNSERQKLSQFWYETALAVVQSSFAMQNLAIQYAQSSFSDAIETLKRNIDASQQWLQTENKSPEQREALPSLMQSGLEAYKRNIDLWQRITERGTETFRTNAEAVLDLTQTVMKKAQDQHYMFF